MSRVFISIVLILILLAAGVSAIVGGKMLRRKPERIDRPAQPVHVAAVELSRGDVTEMLRGYGLAQPIRRAEVSAQVAGTIIDIPDGMRVGAAVRRGDLLAQIDPIKFETELARRRALLLETEEQLASVAQELEENRSLREWIEKDVELARAERDRLERLLSEGAVGESARDTARAAYQAVEQRLAENTRQRVVLEAMQNRLRAQLDARGLEVQSAEIDLSHTQVRAPFDGTIEVRQVSEGDYAAPGGRLFSVVDLSAIELPIEIPASQSAAVREGAPAEILSSEESPRTATGTVVRISPVISPTNRTVSAFLMIPRNEGGVWFPPGTFLSAQVTGRTFEDVYAVPREAIVDGYVFVARDGKADRLHPEFFAYLNEIALTRDDLGGTVTVITSGFERLYDGAPVIVSEDVELESYEAPEEEEETPAGAEAQLSMSNQ